MTTEEKADIYENLDNVLEDLSETEKRLKRMLTNFREAVDSFKQAIKAV